jgi:Adenosine-deaminase (editase) domain
MVVHYSIVMDWLWLDEHYSSKSFHDRKESSFNRSFRYFYGELHQLAHGYSPLRNIFLDCHTDKLQLRNNISIHLVLSDAANGDAREYLPSDTNAYDAVNQSFSSITFQHVMLFRFK